jgi:hypothetical protein
VAFGFRLRLARWCGDRLAVRFRRRLRLAGLAGQAIDELALIDRRNLDGNVVAEGARLLFQQHRQDDRRGEGQHDRADEAPPGFAPHLVDDELGVVSDSFSHRVPAPLRPSSARHFQAAATCGVRPPPLQQPL